jgi:uncharacterized protein YxjI
MIRQKMVVLANIFFIMRGDDRDGEEPDPVAKVTQKMTLCRPGFSIQTPRRRRKGRKELRISGDWTGHDYVFTRGKETVATVSKKWTLARDNYSVEIQPSENVFLILACCLIIDQCTTLN